MSGFQRDIDWARYQARQRELEEQAERQRQRAPEPGYLGTQEPGRDDGRAIGVIVVLVLVIIGLTFGWWAFWICLTVVVVLIALVMWADDRYGVR
jgi:Flp pilus assembly protein TadB